MSFETEIDELGFALIEGVLTSAEVEALIEILNHADIARFARRDAVFGARNLLSVRSVAQLAQSWAILGLVSRIIGSECRPVRGLFFDKTSGANWPVAWHQDISIAVAARHDIEGWTNWSVKAGDVHVQPPVGILEKMITVRIHLDNCDADNGPLRVMPRSHRLGQISASKQREMRNKTEARTCLAPAGSALFMRPLLVHASSAARIPGHRRVIHLEFAPPDLLPPPLEWLHQAEWEN